MGTGSKILCEGNLMFGNGSHFNGGSSIICWKEIVFGENCLVSWECLFMDTDFHVILDKHKKQINYNKTIIIGDHVWIGCRTTVLKGAKVPKNTVIAACSNVTKALNIENSVYASNNLKKENIIWR